MSDEVFPAPVALLESSVSDGAFRVWVWLHGQVGAEHSHPGIKSIARSMGRCPKAVRRAIVELAQAGWLTVDKSSGRSPTYAFPGWQTHPSCCEGEHG